MWGGYCLVEIPAKLAFCGYLGQEAGKAQAGPGLLLDWGPG